MLPGDAMGLWVKGDGSGALLNIQIRSPREYHGCISDHYIDLDFVGWRYVELLLRERDSERLTDYVWPYSSAGEATPCTETPSTGLMSPKSPAAQRDSTPAASRHLAEPDPLAFHPPRRWATHRWRSVDQGDLPG